MNLKSLLDEAKNSLAVLRHELLLSNGSTAVHCFFEGQTDESFYSNHIRPYLKGGQKFVSHICGNKDQVYATFAELSPRIKNPTIGLFFADKDIDELIPVPRLTDEKIYVTESYSIENHLADVEVIERAIAELFRLGSGHKACTLLCQTYQHQFNFCTEYLHNLIAWILFHRRKNNRPNLNNIKLDALCQLNEDLIFSAKSFESSIEELDRWTQVITPKTYFTQEHEPLVLELKKHTPSTILRGKFVLWFVVSFLNIAKNEIAAHPPRRSINIELTTKNAIDLLGPRCRTPASLGRYLDMSFR